MPPPSDFLPVQSTLPKAVYQYQNPCKVNTVTDTIITVETFSGAISTTLSGTIIYFPSQSTAYTITDFTSFSIVYRTTETSTLTIVHAVTATVIHNTFTVTATAPTASVYAACATNNFADAILVNGIPEQIVSYQIVPDNQTVVAAPIEVSNSPAACCSFAFQQGVDTWAYANGTGCSLISGTDGQCTPVKTSDSVTSSNVEDPNLPGYVVGNAVCGRFTKSSPAS